MGDGGHLEHVELPQDQHLQGEGASAASRPPTCPPALLPDTPVWCRQLPLFGFIPPPSVWLLAAHVALGIASSAGHLLELSSLETLQERVGSPSPVLRV